MADDRIETYMVQPVVGTVTVEQRTVPYLRVRLDGRIVDLAIDDPGELITHLEQAVTSQGLPRIPPPTAVAARAPSGTPFAQVLGTVVGAMFPAETESIRRHLVDGHGLSRAQLAAMPDQAIIRLHNLFEKHGTHRSPR